MDDSFPSNQLPRNRRSHGHVYLAVILPALLCLTTTLNTTPPTTCQIGVQITGEKLIAPTIELAPPTQVYPGQPVSVCLSGGYVFLNYLMDCSDDGDYLGGGYAHADELAWSSYTHTVRVNLVKASVRQEEECWTELIVPSDTRRYPVVCGENGNVVGYVDQENLPRSPYSRTVTVYLDENPLTSTECGKECSVEFVIPPDTPRGLHELEIQLYWFRETSEIEVVERGTPTP